MKDLPLVILGSLRSDVLCQGTLKEFGCRIGPKALQMLKRITFSRKRTRLRLVAISNAELGFEGDATRLQSYDAAIKLGFKIVPAETGPALAAIYRDQPAGEELRIGMEPIFLSRARYVYTVEHTRATGRWLSLAISHITIRLPPSTLWVFGQEAADTDHHDGLAA